MRFSPQRRTNKSLRWGAPTLAAVGLLLSPWPEVLVGSLNAQVPTATAAGTETPTQTATLTRTPTPTQTATLTRTPTPTRTLTPTRTATRIPTRTSTPTATRTPTPTPTPTLTRTAVPTATPIPDLDPNWAAIASAPSQPLSRLLFGNYYAWFDMSTWNSGVTADQPMQPYASADRAVMERHVNQAKGAGIDALNLAWLGPANPTDTNLAALLPVAATRGFWVTANFETDSPLFRSRRDFRVALRYLLATHAAAPGYLRVDGRPVIFFWRPRAIHLDGAESPVEAWRALREEVDPQHQTIWIAEGDRFEYLEVFDGIFPYSIAWADDVSRIDRLYASRTRQQSEQLGARKLWVATVMPGYDDLGTGRSEAFTRDRENGAFFDETWRAAVATDPDWIMITSWNEWVEGSQIEPSRSYGERYLNSNRSHAFGWKTVSPAVPAFSPPPLPVFEEELPPPAPEAPRFLGEEILHFLEPPVERTQDEPLAGLERALAESSAEEIVGLVLDEAGPPDEAAPILEEQVPVESRLAAAAPHAPPVLATGPGARALALLGLD